jgi:hypothetical protein
MLQYKEIQECPILRTTQQRPAGESEDAIPLNFSLYGPG